MIFTKEQVSKMKEEEFQNAVLIPLFRKMGFRDVKRFDGGNLERGKDIVMWKPSDLGQRLNYGVVVKAVKITGNAKTTEGAMNVLNQVRQMLKNRYLNPVNGRQERIQRCFIACSKEITAEAINSIEGELENHFDKLLEWIEPETNLYDLIEQYLPEQTVFEKLSEIQKKLDEQMKETPYRIVGNSDKEFRLIGKHEKAHEEMPIEVKSRFQWNPDTEEGKEFYEKLKAHFEKGTPIEIDGKFIESFNLPDFLPDWWKPKATENAKLQLFPRRSDLIIPWRIERHLTTGEVVSLDRIDLQSVQIGTKEITLKNDKQSVPWQFTVVVNQEEETFNFNYNYKFFGFNVAQHLQGIRFFEAMSKSGRTLGFRSDVNLKVFDSEHINIKSGLSEKDIKNEIKLLEALLFIQEKTSTIININDRNISNEDVRHIFEVVEIIKNGKMQGTLSTQKILLPLEKAKETISRYENEVEDFLLLNFDYFTTSILGYEVNLGKTVASFNGYIKQEDFLEIQNKIEENELEIEFSFTPKDESVVFDFIKWDCEDRHTRIKFTS